MLTKILFFFLPFICFGHQYEVGICAIFQNEGPYLKEWIEYHRLIGIEHFYLYNHRSTDNFKEILAPYIKNGTVELVNLEDKPKNLNQWNRLQTGVYRHGARRAYGKCKWLACIDIDEFIFPVRDETLPHFLSNFEDYDGVVINWQIFGTSHLKHLDPKKLMIEQLILKAEPDFGKNDWVKSIFRPESIDTHRGSLAGWSPHFPRMKKGHFAVNALYEPVRGAGDPSLPIEIIRIHHYMTRSEEHFFNRKLKLVHNQNEERQEWFREYEEYNAVEDTSILRYAPLLREVVFDN